MTPDPPTEIPADELSWPAWLAAQGLVEVPEDEEETSYQTDDNRSGLNFYDDGDGEQA